MRGWRSRLIFSFIVYFAGFATAIYFLASPPDAEDTIAKHSDKSTPNVKFDSQEFVDSFNSGMRKCIEFGKEAAYRAGKIMKAKVKEMREEMRDV